MPEILPRHYITGIIIFTFFILGGMAVVSELNAKNPNFIDDDKYDSFQDTFNVYDNVTAEVGTLRSNIEDADTDFGAFGVLNSLISSAWQSLKLLFTSFGFMDAVFRGLETFLGIPAWVSTLVILLATVLLVFAIFSAIFQRDI